MTIRSIIRTGLAASMLGLATIAQAANPKPFTVPEVRDWHGADGSFEIPAGARVTYSDPRLENIARQFAQDYTTILGNKLEVAHTSKPRKGDIAFRLKPAKKVSPESYTVDIADHVTVTAPAEQGARWGASTLLQLFDQAPSLPKGRIADAPMYGFRGFQIDAGRKYIPLDYLYNLIDVMSYYKLNELNLHLNDNGFTYFYDDDWDKTQAAFRLESETFPGLTARDGSYSKNDFRDFQRYALSRGVEVIPEIDVPAHSLAFTRFRPSIGSTPEEYGKDHLNIMSEETYGFLDSLFTEYLAGPDPVFVGSRFNIGTDEYSNRDSVVVEKFRYFTDRYARFAEKYGKKPMVWGSLTHAKGKQPVKVDNVEMIVWSNGFANPQEMHDLGYKMVSMPDQILYIVPHAGYYHDYLDIRDIYNTWAPHDFRGFTFEEGDPQIVGGMFAVWNDHPTNGVTVKDIHHRVMHALPTVAAKNWSGTKVTVPFDEFAVRSAALSEAPGVNYLSTFGPDQLDILEVAELAPSTVLPVTEIGYDYTVEFDIDGAEEAKGTVLFESPNGIFWLSNPVTGTLGYSRDDKLYYLRHDVRPGEKSHVKIQGDKDALRFYLNGRLVDDMNLRWWRQNENSRKIAELRTLVFPLHKTGDFKSKISNLRVSNYLLAVHCSATGKERCTVRIMSTDGTRPVELAIYDSKSDLRNSNLRTRLLDGDTIINLKADEIIKYSVTDAGEMLEKGGTRRFGDFFVENGALVDIRLSAEGISVSSTGKEDTAWRSMEAELKEVFADDLAYLRAKGDNVTEEEADSLSRKMYDWQYDYCVRKPMLGFLLDLDERLSNYSFTDTEIKNKVDVYKRSYLNFRPDHSSHRSIAANLEKGYQMKGGKYNDFTARNADGDTVRASEFFRDRVTMVICWATWCLPCRKDALDAVPVFEKYKDRGLAAFSLAHEFNSPDEFRKAIAEDKLPWPSLYDLDDEFGVFEKHGTSNAAFFLVDRDGTIVATAYSAEELEPAIAALLPE